MFTISLDDPITGGFIADVHDPDSGDWLYAWVFVPGHRACRVFDARDR